jgi:uncharacterized protein
MGSLETLGTPDRDAGERRALATGLGVVVAIAVLGLTWSKWLPYSHKVAGLSGTRAWEGSALTEVASGAATWWQGAWAFTMTYTAAVWKAMLVGLLLAAAVDALLPRVWLRRSLTRRTTWGGAALAGAASMPSMMCTCCAAPVAVSLRRSDVPVAAAVAYWLGNPVLNPAVLVFLALVGPWQWAGVRLAVGVLLVLGAAALAGALAGRYAVAAPATDATPASAEAAVGAAPERWAGVLPASGRFVRSLARLSVTLLPEYAVVVFAVGAAAHVVSWDASWLHGGVLGLVVLLVVATLLVIPTGGEIPVLLALTAAGAGPWALGAVLLALPALSLPSMLMVGRALTWRATAGVATAVVVAALAAGALLAALT